MARGLLLTGLAACCGGIVAQPVPEAMPQVMPRHCDNASCGPGQCSEPDGEAACQCAVGWARTDRFTCVELVEDAAAGCTSPESCGAEKVCERLTGRCLDRTEQTCMTGELGPRGEQGEGDHCIRAAADKVEGCGALDQGSFCSGDLACTPTGPSGHSGVICGHPTFRAGVCRKRCDPCATSTCTEGQGCVLVADVGGVCMPHGFSESDCGAAPCRPGSVCSLGGRLGGEAHGNCEVECSAEVPTCPVGKMCRALHERFPDVRVCR